MPKRERERERRSDGRTDEMWSETKVDKRDDNNAPFSRTLV